MSKFVGVYIRLYLQNTIMICRGFYFGFVYFVGYTSVKWKLSKIYV